MGRDEKFEPFKAGDWQSRQQQRSPKEAEGEEIKFERNYPIFQQYLRSRDFGPIFQQCEQSCIELDRFIRTGGREAAQEAQHALNAYGRSMQLATELMQLKAKLRGR